MLLPLTGYSQEAQSDQHIEVSLRMIGHQILLNSGDSTSRVLPIEKINNSYKIRFESDFEFQPEELVQTVNQVMQKAKLDSGYIVEVKECETEAIVYAYEMITWEGKDLIPCSSRDVPKSCYTLLFTLLQPQEQASQNNSQLIYFLLSIIALLLVSIYFFRRKRGKAKRNPNLIVLGDYTFDKLNTELLFDKERIELTSKEADLLILLHDAVNTTIEREVILKRVWGDEGDYVGRTLDVFISKLRKKLEADSKIKIVNIRGVGYKLVLDV